MQFKRVAQVYKETTITTMPVTDYLINLLNDCLRIVRQCQDEHCAERNEQLTKAQNILFELMAITNHDQAEGKRLFQVYVYLNQCLVQVRLYEDQEALQRVAQYLKEMIESWTVVVKERRNGQLVDRV